MKYLIRIVLVCSVAVWGCGDDGDTSSGGAGGGMAGASGSGGAGGAGGMALQAFTAQEVQMVFDSSCSSGQGTGCHSQLDSDGVAAQGLSLDDFDSNGLVIDAASNQAAGVLRIMPGSRQDSYLWHKINGTHADSDVGGTGSQMPLGGTALDAETIERIGLYIDGL